MQPGQRIGSYTLETTLGQGGMGAVFLARDPRGQQVAVKVLHSYDPELMARFEREGKVLQALSVPGVVRLFEYGLHERRPFLVQEFCPGGDLAGLLRERGRLEPDHARELVRELALALDAVHQAGIVHRDLKPANVLLVEGRPKVTDFGLARAKGVDAKSLTETGVLLGTPAYMAPEQLQDAREVDARTDVYALGVILYELLAGRRPFQGATALATASAVLEGHPPPLPPEVPAELREVVWCAMAPDPADRYSSAGFLGEALEAASAPPAGRWTPWVAGLVIALLALVAAAALAPSGDPGLGTPSPSPSPADSAPSTPETKASAPTPQPTTQPSPTPLASETPAQPAPSGPSLGRAYVAALAKCVDDPVQAELELEALADSGHAGAATALVRLLLTIPAKQKRATKLFRSLPLSPERAVLQAMLRARDDPGPSPLAALRALQGRALAADGAAREIFDLAAVDPEFERALTQLEVRVNEAEIDPLFKALLGRRPAWINDWLLLYRRSPVFSRLRPLILDKIRALPHPGRRRFLLARLQLDRPLDAAWFRPEEDPERLLREAAEEGYLPAAAELGARLFHGRFAGPFEECQRWLTVAAYGGIPESADLLLRNTPMKALFAIGSVLRSPEALYRNGHQFLSRNRERALQLWRVAAAQGHAKSSLALGDALRADPKESARHYRAAADDGAFVYLEAFAKSPGETLDKLTLLAGLAYAGRPEAARAVAVLLEKQGKREQARSFCRRAHAASSPGPEREALQEDLKRLAPPPGGPVHSAGQLELLALTRSGNREAIKELGRRAHLECPPKLRLGRLEAAGVAGDADCLLYAARTYQWLDKDRARGLYLRAIELGRTDALVAIGKNRELFARADRGDPWANYGIGIVLVGRGREQDAMAPLKFAASKGIDLAERLLLDLELGEAYRKGAAPTADLRRRAKAEPSTLGNAALRESPPDLAQAQRYLLTALLHGKAARRDLVLLGEALRKRRDPFGQVLAQPWFQAAAQLGHPDAELARVSYLLSKPHQTKPRQEGWTRCLKLLGGLGPRTPPKAWGVFGNTVIHTPRAQREAALRVFSGTKASRHTLWAEAKLRFSLGDVDRAASVLARAKSGALEILSRFRKAEGVMTSAAEGPREVHLERLSDPPNLTARNSLAQHLLVDAILETPHAGEPSLEDCLEPLLKSPKFREGASDFQTYYRRLLR